MSSKVQRNLCVLFADVCGSTRLYEKLGDKEALHAVERCIKRLTLATEQYHGRVVKTIGNEVMTVFDDAEAAFHAACEMRQRVGDLPPTSGVKLAIRVGFHYGPAIEENNDLFGEAVSTAAHMAGLAKAGQIITSGDTVGALPQLLRRSTHGLDTPTVKGEAADVRIFEVIWQESEELTTKSASVAPAPIPARLRVRHAGVDRLLDAGNSLLWMGRDSASDIIINDRRASRAHARIERRRDKFVLIDQSTNGTYVSFEGEAEFALRREEVILRARGRISFGYSHAGESGEIVEFQVG